MEAIQIDRKIVTEATLLDIQMDMCYDTSEYNEILAYYRKLLSKYDLFDIPFTEDAATSDYRAPTEEDDYAIITCVDGKYGVQKSRFFDEIDPVYDRIEQFKNWNLAMVCRNGKYGVIDLCNKGKVVIPLEYDSVELHDEDHLCAVVGRNGQFQYLSDGKSDWVDEVIFPKYAGWVRVRLGERYGWLDENLKVTFDQNKAHEPVIPFSFETFNLVKEHHEATREDLNRCSELDMVLRNCDEEDREKLDNELRLMFASLYRHYPAEEDVLRGKGTEGGFCDESPEIESDEPTHVFCCEEWTIVKKNGKYGVYDRYEEKYLLEPIYDELVEEENYHHLITRIGDKFGFFNSEFNVAPQFENYRIGRMLSFVRFRLNGKWGYINKDGEWTEKIEEARAYAKNPWYGDELYGTAYGII